jgi:3-deoxy-D-manno-octulosonic acid kinase
MAARYRRIDHRHILYDGGALENAGPELFDPQAWRARGALLGQARGRGAAWFVQDGEHGYVLRHYRRGGLVGRLIHDRYVWLGLARTRAWREWRLLAHLHGQGLPVPRPVAAQVVRKGWHYGADLLTARLPDTRSLAQALAAAPLTAPEWRRIGACIGRFHQAGVWHADLNAHNILLDADTNIYLIDFDRGRLRRPADAWQRANLARLLRSLRKLALSPADKSLTAEDAEEAVESAAERRGARAKSSRSVVSRPSGRQVALSGESHPFHFREARDWPALLLGYREGNARSP